MESLAFFAKREAPIAGCESRKDGEGQTHGYQDSDGTLINNERRLPVAPLGVFSGNPDGRRNDVGRIGGELIAGNFGELQRSRIHVDFFFELLSF